MSQKPKVTTSLRPMNRAEVLRAGLESLTQQRELRELPGQCQTNATCRKGGTLHSERSKADKIMKVFAKLSTKLNIKLNITHEKCFALYWKRCDTFLDSFKIKKTYRCHYKPCKKSKFSIFCYVLGFFP